MSSMNANATCAVTSARRATRAPRLAVPERPSSRKLWLRFMLPEAQNREQPDQDRQRQRQAEREPITVASIATCGALRRGVEAEAASARTPA